MDNIISKLGITPGVMTLPLFRSAVKAASEREERIYRLVSIFPTHKNDVLANIRDIETQTVGIEWCIDYALTGKTWQEIKSLYQIKGERE